MITSKSSRPYADIAIDSFLKNTKLNSQDEFLLVDNDNEGTYPIKNIISHKTPQSFSKNCNSIIDYADSRNIFILSNDIVFTDNWNQALTQFNNLILIPSCNQTHLYNLDSLILTPNMKIKDYNNRSGSLNKISKLHQRSHSPKLYEKPLMPFYGFMLPSQVYKKIGYFDERFGIGGGEDVDYRLRAISMDIPVKYTTQSYLLHFGGKTTWDGPETSLEIQNRNSRYFEEFKNKWGEDLAHLCLVNGNPLSIVEKYNLQNLLNNQNYSQVIKAILNSTNRN